MSIGQELLDVPFPEMIYKMANAIAQGQRRLDKASLDTARALAKAQVKVIPEIFEIVEKKKISDTLDASVSLPGGAGDVDTIAVRSEAAKAVSMSLLQAGLLPLVLSIHRVDHRGQDLDFAPLLVPERIRGRRRVRNFH